MSCPHVSDHNFRHAYLRQETLNDQDIDIINKKAYLFLVGSGDLTVTVVVYEIMSEEPFKLSGSYAAKIRFHGISEERYRSTL